MNDRLLITTAISLMLGTAAFAQSPNDPQRNNPPAAAQSHTNSNQPNSNSAAPSASSSPASSSRSSTPSAQNAQSAPSEKSKSPTTTSQSAPNTTGNSNNDSTRSQAQSNQPSAPSQGRSDNNAAAPSQAQSAQPSNSPNQAQTNTAPPANNQTQNQTQPAPSGANANTNTAAQPSNNQTNTAQSPSTNVNISANLNDSQRTRVSESITRLNAPAVNNVNFSLSVGTVVPRDVRFQPLPADVVEIMPQYRGYNFVVVRDDIVIVEPSSYRIVDVLPRAGRSSAAAPASQSTAAAPASRKTTFSDSDREVIRKHARSRAEQPRTEQRTTGSSAASTRVRVGDRLPDSVEIRSFPDEVHRESPTLREYRYIERDNRTYLVEPRERTILEEIE
jgi:hypothetical protein